MKQIDLNCDLGESFGPYRLGRDAEIIPLITSANVACGWHAGDPAVMGRTVKMAVKHGVAVGAHPGYPDLLGFGRRHMACAAAEIHDYIIYQVGALQAFCKAHGTRLRHVKPHGALYNRAVENQAVLRAVAEAVAAVDDRLLLVGLAGPAAAQVAETARKAGLQVVFEAFADRAYTPEGTLVPRAQEGAVIKDPRIAAQRVLEIATQKIVTAVDGSEIALMAQTIRVHGDSREALEMVTAVRAAMIGADIHLAPMTAEK